VSVRFSAVMNIILTLMTTLKKL